LARFGEHAPWFGFTSDRFDHTSELPPDASAGNRFYGRDVAEFIAAGLGERGLDSSFIDEDWGWQAHARRADESVLEIFDLPQPGRVPRGRGRLDAHGAVTRQGTPSRDRSRFRERELDPDAIVALEDAFEQAGIARTRTPPS
jgi:hypothetical protein